MWVIILLFSILLPIVAIAGIAAFGGAAIVMLRRRGSQERIAFNSVVHAYLALMMLVGVFVAASGLGMAGKVVFAESIQHEFSYAPPREWDDDFGSPNPHDDDVEQDAIAAAVLLLVGAGLFIPHAAGTWLLQRRGAVLSRTISGGHSLVGVATATIGFLAAGGTALADILQKFADDSGSWREHHPGEPLSFAVVLFFAMGWYAYHLWGDVTRDLPAASPASASERAL